MIVNNKKINTNPNKSGCPIINVPCRSGIRDIISTDIINLYSFFVFNIFFVNIPIDIIKYGTMVITELNK